MDQLVEILLKGDFYSFALIAMIMFLVWFYKEIRKNYIENELNEQERADKALTLYAELLFKIKTTQFTENDICNIQQLII
ncbi:hypothetical protein N3C_2397 [Clostridium sp. N3C]|uniref:hypothetical protein n=1 Tax=Clostridium sp. N3C TaxID=1776758 RepID=UPI00092DFBE4|nr:hypothetical protein [Clostridium sp. N3C]SCN25614.1 hypothetical protein N3C_2397 [Clostridium sp. N3C]